MSPAGTKKVRVYEIAKELKMSSDAVVEMIRALDIPVRSHMSTVDPNLADRLRDKMAEEKKVVKEGLSARRAVPPPRSKATLVPPATDDKKPVVTPKPEIVTPKPEVVMPAKPKDEKPKPEIVPPKPKPEPAPTEEKPAVASPPKPEEQPAAKRPAPKPAPPASPPTPSQPAAVRPAAAQRAAQAPKAPARPAPKTPKSTPPRPKTPAQRPMAAGFSVPQPGRDLRPRTGPGAGRRRDKKKKKRAVDQKEVAANVRQTLASMESGRGSRRRRRDRDREGSGAALEEARRVVRVAEFITLGELASAMGIRPAEALAASLKLGLMVNINRRLDRVGIEAIADEFDYEVAFVSEYGAEQLETEEPIKEEDLTPRPPVITVMGHVDHGKTSLLDHIRKENVISGEAGGITQHIGAYQVVVDDRKLTFLDTPGHEAFTAMRARGADVTDIVVLVVAADDRVMPQTIEAIDHARAAKVPMVVAINKIDLPGANPDMVRQELTRQNVIVEEYGGEVPSVEISAKKGTNIDKLLELLVLQADIMELKADSSRLAKGVVLEAKMERGRGIVPTVLVQQGTLEVGAPFVAGQAAGKVRAMTNERGQQVVSAGPSTPVEVLGWEEMPQAGDTFHAVGEEREARDIAQKRQQLVREYESRGIKHTTLEDLHSRIQEGEISELKIIIKGDVDGSVEALAGQLGDLSNDEVRLRVIRQGVGRINESDVLLADVSDAIILGFHIRPEPRARELANRKNIDIHLYQVIYEAVDEMRKAMAGLLKPEIKETVTGSAEIRRVFHVSKSGAVAGCMVVAGTIRRNAKARLIRGDDEIWSGELDSLKRFKEDVREVQSGFECGIKLAGFDEIKEGDMIEGFTVEEVKPTTL